MQLLFHVSNCELNFYPSFNGTLIPNSAFPKSRTLILKKVKLSNFSFMNPMFGFDSEKFSLLLSHILLVWFYTIDSFTHYSC